MVSLQDGNRCAVRSRPGEQYERIETGRFLNGVRVCYAAFCFMLSLFTGGHSGLPWWASRGVAAMGLAYSIGRYYAKPTTIRRLDRFPVPTDLLDFAFHGVLVYLSGGMGSVFQYGYVLPVFGSAIRYGMYGGILSTCIALVVSLCIFFSGRSVVSSAPVGFHVISAAGTLVLAVWMIGRLVEEERRLRECLYNSSITDYLTGLYSLGFFRERVKEEIDRCRRQGGGFAIAFLDLDGFKEVNDDYGHLAGDSVLRHMSSVLRESVRKGESLARYGGDEFVLLMPGSDRERAEKAGRRIQREVAMRPTVGNGKAIQVGISVGVATFPEDATDLEGLLAVADRRMYQTKPSRQRRSAQGVIEI